jgi:hypothetical protein
MRMNELRKKKEKKKKRERERETLREEKNER